MRMVVGYSDFKAGQGGLSPYPAMIVRYKGGWHYVAGSENHGGRCQLCVECPRKHIKLEYIRTRNGFRRPDKRQLILAGKVIQWEDFVEYQL